MRVKFSVFIDEYYQNRSRSFMIISCALTWRPRKGFNLKSIELGLSYLFNHVYCSNNNNESKWFIEYKRKLPLLNMTCDISCKWKQNHEMRKTIWNSGFISRNHILQHLEEIFADKCAVLPTNWHQNLDGTWYSCNQVK
jgi:hypothetical protein